MQKQQMPPNNNNINDDDSAYYSTTTAFDLTNENFIPSTTITSSSSSGGDYVLCWSQQNSVSKVPLVENNFFNLHRKEELTSFYHPQPVTTAITPTQTMNKQSSGDIYSNFTEFGDIMYTTTNPISNSTTSNQHQHHHHQYYTSDNRPQQQYNFDNNNGDLLNAIIMSDIPSTSSNLQYQNYDDQQITTSASFASKAAAENDMQHPASPYYSSSQCSTTTTTTTSSPRKEVHYGPITVRPRKRPAPTLASGRKSKYISLTPDDEHKRQLRRFRNRLAADKCKQKRNEIEESLEQKRALLVSSNAQLKRDNERLQETLAALHKLLKQHEMSCKKTAQPLFNF